MDNRTCACGCGGSPKEGNAYIHGHSGKHEKLPRTPHRCAMCGAEFEGTLRSRRYKFCSAECRLRYNATTKSVDLECKHCGKKFTLLKSRIRSGDKGRGTFCGVECSRAYRSEQRRTNPTKCATYRTTAFEIHGKKCVQCGYNKHVELLVAHHVDGNRENNRPDNLTVLCPTCHAEAHLEMSGMKYNLSWRPGWRRGSAWQSLATQIN